MALCRRTLGIERHRYAVADSINSGLTRWRMAVINEKMNAAAELGRSSVCKRQIQPEYGDEQVDAGRDCRTRLARPNSQARTRTGRYSFFLFSLPRAGLYPVDPYSCYVCNHTCTAAAVQRSHTTTLQKLTIPYHRWSLKWSHI